MTIASTGVDLLGKTRMLKSYVTNEASNLMYILFSGLVRLMAPVKARRGHAVIPRRLLEKAEARAGSDPRQAAELRSAAVAYLRVVR